MAKILLLIIACMLLNHASPSVAGAAQKSHKDLQNTKIGPLAKVDHASFGGSTVSAAEISDKGCPSGQDNRQSDLCAQWKAADSAAQSAKWALWTFIATVVGLLVGSGTLLAAWLAARWAKKAANFTEAGAIAAADSVAEARRIGEAQVQAYVSIIGLRVKKLEYGLEVQAISKNTGQSPAFVMQLIYDLHLSNGDKPRQISEERLAIGAGMEQDLNIMHFKTREPENAMIVVKVFLNFEDVFGKSHSQIEAFAGPYKWQEDGTGSKFEFRHNLISAIKVLHENG